MSEYWIKQAKSGKTHGPTSGSNLKKLVERGELKPEDQIGKSADGPWRTASKVKGLVFKSQNEEPSSLPRGDELIQSEYSARSDSRKKSVASRSWVIVGSTVVGLTCLVAIILVVWDGDNELESTETQSTAAKTTAAKTTEEEGFSSKPATLDENSPKGKPGLLGFQFKPINKRGLLVEGVSQNTPAETGGLKKGDFITKINGVSMLNCTSEEEAYHILNKNLFADVPCVDRKSVV